MTEPHDHQAAAANLLDQARRAATQGAADRYQEAAMLELLLGILPRLDRLIELLERQTPTAQPLTMACCVDGCDLHGTYRNYRGQRMCWPHADADKHLR